MTRPFMDFHRSGFTVGVSTGKIAKMMVAVLAQLPPDETPCKEAVLRRMGMIGLLARTRDVNAAWSKAKRLVVEEHGDSFHLEGRMLRRGPQPEGSPREKLTAAGHRQLSAMAAKEGMTPDELLRRLISCWRRRDA